MVDAIQSRRVVIVRDTASPLWVIRCSEPCRPDGWCQGRDLGKKICWLGSGMCRAGVMAIAERGGHWKVVHNADPR